MFLKLEFVGNIVEEGPEILFLGIFVSDMWLKFFLPLAEDYRSLPEVQGWFLCFNLYWRSDFRVSRWLKCLSLFVGLEQILLYLMDWL